MMILSLAALAQAAAAPHDVFDQAMICSTASVIEAGVADARVSSHMGYFVMVAARARPEDQLFDERATELMQRVPDLVPRFLPGGDLAGRASAVLAECDRAYPRARSAAPATLPAEPLDRDIMCATMLGMLLGMSEEHDTGGAPEAAAVTRAVEAYSAELSDARLQAAGLAEEAAIHRRTADVMRSSLDHGNAEAIGRACIGRIAATA